MSPKVQIKQLQSMCVKNFSYYLTYVLSDEKCKHRKAVDEYLTNVSFPVRQSLLEHILNSENLDAATRFNCLNVLLKNNVKLLETGIFPYTYYVKILEVIIRRGKNLQQLNLRGLWVHDEPELVQELLCKLNNLRILIIPHIGADFILKPIGCCSQLSVLDISGECPFSSEELCEFGSLSIKVLYIGSYGKKKLCEPEEDSIKALSSIIKNLPNLTSIKTYSFTGSALFNLFYDDHSSSKTNLLHICDTQTTVANSEAIVKLCPKLQSIYLDAPEENVLLLIKQLEHLTNLRLARFDYVELVSYLQHSGAQICSLQLYSSKDIPIDVSYLSTVCPNLNYLDCYRVNLTVTQLDSYFMCLECIDILYCNVDEITLKYLFTNCPVLKKAVIGDILKITDGDIFRLCAECEFLYLEELWLSCAKYLTTTSVQLLMSHCPNLKSLGQLSGWNFYNMEGESLNNAEPKNLTPTESSVADSSAKATTAHSTFYAKSNSRIKILLFNSLLLFKLLRI
ncbi:hypothetical protein FQA39_LY03912 [Lamprigera yunnana]|nr:hypothetical protein FQA39_LY03912 [Lamprigera yunnana]